MDLLKAFFNVITGNVHRTYDLKISLEAMEKYHLRLIRTHRDSYVAAEELNQMACLGGDKCLTKHEWADLFRQQIKEAN